VVQKSARKYIDVAIGPRNRESKRSKKEEDRTGWAFDLDGFKGKSEQATDDGHRKQHKRNNVIADKNAQ